MSSESIRAPAPEKTAEALSDADYRMLADFRKSVRQFLAFSEKAAASRGLTPQQYQAILAIKARTLGGTITIGELAGELLIQPHSGVELVDRLETGGYVVRSTDAKDRRRVVLQLTEKAQGVLNELPASHIEELRGMAPMLAQLLDRLKLRETDVER